MSGVEIARRLHQHQRWAARHLFAAAASLTDKQLDRRFEMGPGSLRGTLFHLYQAQSLWLAALLGNPVAPPPEPLPSLAGLRAALEALDERWAAYLGNLQDSDLDKPILKAHSRTPDQPIATSMADVLLHVATHASYHTAQAINMMRRLGVDPLPDYMLIVMSRRESMTI